MLRQALPLLILLGTAPAVRAQLSMEQQQLNIGGMKYFRFKKWIRLLNET